MQRRLISARFAALYDHTRMKGLYEVTLAANRGLRRQVMLDTILESVRRLPSQAAAALDAAGIPLELLIFEITENVVMKDLSDAREVMKKLDRLGVRLAIDDFGTGHSSLAYLKQFESAVDSAIVRAPSSTWLMPRA